MTDPIVIVTHLNKAAYLIMNGAELVEFVGKYWSNCKLRVRVERELFINSRKGIVNYQSYMKTRAKLKLKIKHAYGVI